LLLPNRKDAFIQPEKLTGYLLSETHSVGKSKAKFFRELGFDKENFTILERELLKLAHSQEVTEIVTTQHGIKYVIIETISTPKSKQVNILTRPLTN